MFKFLLDYYIVLKLVRMKLTNFAQIAVPNLATYNPLIFTLNFKSHEYLDPLARYILNVHELFKPIYRLGF